MMDTKKVTTTTTTTTTTVENYLSRKQKNLRNHGLITFIFLFTIVVLSATLYLSPYKYGTLEFLDWMFLPLLFLSLVFLMLSLFVFPAAAMGLSKWRIVNKKLFVPLLLILLSAFAHWVYFYTKDPVVGMGVWQSLRTVLLVGFTEEWLYRGLLFTALSLAVGVRHGAIASCVLFGVAHSMNLIGGTTLSSTVFQVLLTCLSGAAFVLAVVGSRSIWFGVFAHALYDFFVIYRNATLDDSVITNVFALLPLTVGIIVGTYSFIKLFRLKDSDFYP